MKKIAALTVAMVATSALIGACASGGGPAGAGPSAPGVNGKTITVSVISDNSGPIAGAFKGASYGAEAYADYVNSTGGVDGYKLSVQSLDSQTTCAGATTAAAQAVSSSFAIVGGISLSDQCEVPSLKTNPNTPFIASALSPQVEALPNYYSITPSKPGTAVGPFRYLAQKMPAAVTHAAVLDGTTPGAVSYQGYADAAMKEAGFKFSYQSTVDPTVTDFTSYIVRMRDAGVQYLFLNMFGQQIADILDQMALQNWHPQVVQSVDSYVANWFQTTKPDANENLLVVLESSMYLGEDAASVPEVTTFKKWLAEAAPSFAPDTYSATAWGEMALFANALANSMKSSGGKPDQAAVLKALAATKTFTDNDLFAPAGIGSRTPPTCYVIVEATSSDSWRRMTPATGYQCSPGGYLAAGS